MKPNASSFKIFSILFGVIYTLAFYFNWQMFRYYPLVGRFSVAALPKASGPPINWYGWIATAAIVSALAAIAVPRKLAERLPVGLSWQIPTLVLVVIFIYEKRWFM